MPSHYIAPKVVEWFIKMVIQLHGVRRALVSDHNPIFTSHFRKKLFEFMGIKLKISSSYHPQIDGQTEVMNRYLEKYF